MRRAQRCAYGHGMRDTATPRETKATDTSQQAHRQPDGDGTHAGGAWNWLGGVTAVVLCGHACVAIRKHERRPARGHELAWRAHGRGTLTSNHGVTSAIDVQLSVRARCVMLVSTHSAGSPSQPKLHCINGRATRRGSRHGQGGRFDLFLMGKCSDLRQTNRAATVKRRRPTCARLPLR